ncbi:hypothetical protein VE01_03348 [Pseudogymnoascus verrucosus]|uniref:DUF7779 domain-containing protein n=1 Tax=Pseudogymnoascus verrucosus TaxID=342668 RepID=A0A1B8GST1_9PEZI|nr:uncharacterized protein VE01_03348 [Pseudogymnoascus verrucosus]OBT98860.1 hypothetical protein VE01_03348 [Pseudogymnoascus verrucosus]
MTDIEQAFLPPCIVFVHGLMGNPRTTWTGISPPPSAESEHKRSLWQKITQKKSPTTWESQPQPVFWPKEFLPRDVPHARIITYGYDAKVVELFQSVSQNSLYAISRDILNDLQISREDSAETSRPILWIAHSLGGIALSQSHALQQKQPHLFGIYSSTIGIIYLGTPHRGSGGATLGLVAASAASCFLQSPNKHLLRSLESSSAELERISDVFSLLPKKVDKTIQEYSFQEDRGMASALPLIGGKVVPDSSSRLDDGVGSTSNIAANHRDMCKFVSSTSRDYLRVISVIKRFSKSTVSDSSSLAADIAPALSQPNIQPEGQYIRASSRDSHRRRESLQFQRRSASSFNASDDGISITSVGINEAQSSSLMIPRHRTSTSSHKQEKHFFELPLLDNPHFTGREQHLQQLQSVFPIEDQAANNPPRRQRSSKDLRRAILMGLGGCGKTEIALKYARLHRNDYTAVIWVDGTSPKTLASSFNRISSIFPRALKGELQQRSNFQFSPRNSTTDLPATLHGGKLFDITKWLRDSHDYSWLVIIDNMDDPDMIDVVEQLIANWHHGHVIITSRNREASRLGTAIQVTEMELSEATELLLLSIRQTCQDETTKELANKLATRLGNLPLAIDQAAAYINYQQMSMDEYLLLLDEEQAYLLGHSSRNRYHKTTQLEDGQYDTVLTTWEISFRHIRKTHLHASLLLQLFAFMNPEEISEVIFSDMAKRSPWDTYGLNGELISMDPADYGLDVELMEVLMSHIKLREAIGRLLSFSLIRRKAQTKTLSIHPCTLGIVENGE